MRMLYPELYAAQVYEPAIMLGELVHLGVETLTHSEKEVVKVKDIKNRPAVDVISELFNTKKEIIEVDGVVITSDKNYNINDNGHNTISQAYLEVSWDYLSPDAGGISLLMM